MTGSTANKLLPAPQASKLLSPQSPIAHSVKITAPVKDQQVPIGDLIISGTSKDNINSNCYVNVIVNDVKPYQNATAAGSGGAGALKVTCASFATSLVALAKAVPGTELTR